MVANGHWAHGRILYTFLTCVLAEQCCEWTWISRSFDFMIRAFSAHDNCLAAVAVLAIENRAAMLPAGPCGPLVSHSQPLHRPETNLCTNWSERFHNILVHATLSEWVWYARHGVLAWSIPSSYIEPPLIGGVLLPCTLTGWNISMQHTTAQ